VEELELEDFRQTIECCIFFITGILSLALALIFFMIIKYSFFKGLGVIFTLAGILEMAAGIFTRFPYKQLRLTDGILSPGCLISMEGIISQTEICLYSAVAAMAVGATFYLAFFKSAQTFWKGMGMGLLIQGLLLACLFQMKNNGFKSYKAMATQPTMEVY
jgi:hypothetical protein